MRRLFLAVLFFGLAGTAAAQIFYSKPGGSGGTSILFAGLGTQADGTFYYCSDCAQVSPCAGGGTGAFAFRVNGAWECAASSGAVSDNTTTDDNVNVGNGSASQSKALANGVLSYATATNTFSAVLGNVENTALSTWAGTSNLTTLGTITPPFVLGALATYDQVRIVPSDKNANAFTGALTSADLTGNRTWALPDADATLIQPATCSGTQKVSAVSGVGAVTCSADTDTTGYATVTDETSDLTQRTKLKFTGAGVTCADDTDKTTCTIPSGSFSSPGAGVIVDTVGDGTLAARTITAGTGISVSNGAGAAGNPTISTDSASVQQFTTGTGAPAGTCTAGRDVYVETDQLRVCTCSDTNTWTCNGKVRAHATDCTALTDGIADEVCFERDANTLYVCEPSSGGCDTAGEWTAVSGGAGAPTDAKYIVAEANGSLSAEIAPSAADQVPVSDSTTAATWRSVPDCDDSGGNHLNYDTGTNAFSCGTSGGSTFDPMTTIDVIDDFVGGTNAAGGYYSGTHGWTVTALSGGTGDSFAGTQAHAGIVRLNSHATNDNSGASLALSQGSVSLATGLQNSGDWELDFLIAPQSVTNVEILVGLIDSAANASRATANRGVWARFDTDSSDATWIFQMCTWATPGCDATGNDTYSKVVASTIAPTATTWNRIRIQRESATSKYSFRVNDETAKTFCASGCDNTALEDSVGMVPVVHFITRTTTGVQILYADFARVRITGLTRY